MLEKNNFSSVVCRELGIDAPQPDLTEWKQLVERIKSCHRGVRIALVGKYVQLHDAYLSVAEALRHAGYALGGEMHIDWVDSETVTPENVAEVLGDADGILVPPPLRFDILEEVSKRLPGFPIVLHGASSVPQEFVKIINENGGKLPDAVGIPEEQLRKAATMAVCKINIDSDLRLAFTAMLRKHFNEHPDHFDPRQYLGDARSALKEMVRHKLVDVLGCNGKA